mgnify:CR=1 FL=1
MSRLFPFHGGLKTVRHKAESNQRPIASGILPKRLVVPLRQHIGAIAKPATHIVSTERCESCHTTVAFRPVTRFEHTEVRGSCAACHNNVQAAGKPPGHIVTSAACDSCHSTTSWTPVRRFDHTGITSGCAACHNGVAATGKSAQLEIDNDILDS